MWDGNRGALDAFVATDLWRRGMERFLDFAVPVPVDRALEVGSETGHLLPSLSRRVRALHAVEASWSSAQAARDAAPDAHVVRGSESALPYAPRSFDLVCCVATLTRPEELGPLFQAVRPGGNLALIVPAATLDPARVLADPSLRVLAPEIRAAIGAVLEAARPFGHTDVEVGRWFLDASMIAVRTVDLLDGALLMAKGRRP